MSASRIPRPAAPAVNPRGRQLLIAAAILILVVAILKTVFGHHENKYEKLASDVTLALQSNDVDKVKSYQNAETATTITRGVVGRAADFFVPLGKLKRVKEDTASDAPDRTHDFTLTFDKGVVRERMKLDPDFKIVHFQFEKAAAE
jgi:hypothetical protein